MCDCVYKRSKGLTSVAYWELTEGLDIYGAASVHTA